MIYIPDSFKMTNHSRLHALMREYPFALLLVTHGGQISTTHLPFMVDADAGEHGKLVAHMARANPHWQLFDGRREALVVFTGPHAYISPSWYQDPVTVPTWNYAVVHAHGRPLIVTDKIRVRAMLEQLVAQHETYIDPPWTTAQAGDYIEQQMDYIVAFEMTIERLEGKFKLNQNRSRADQEGVVTALTGSSDCLKRKVAELMNAHLKDCCQRSAS